MLSGLSGVKNHKYENGVGSFETYSTSCINFERQDTLESVIIPEGITSIGDESFRNCSGLTSIEIPDSVTSIGKMAFYECSDLISVEIPNSVTEIN